MKPQRSIVLAAGLVPLLSLAAIAPASAASDACIVGTWQPIGNAAAEWMQRNAPGIRVAVEQQQGALEFRADGSYAAAGSATAKASSENMSATTRDTRFQAQGTWSTDGGRLTLRPSRESMSGTMKIQGPNGRTIEMPMPKGPAQVQEMQYACGATELETRMAIRNATPIVQRYKRLR